VSPRRLLERAGEALARGDAREALDLVTQARDRDPRLAGLPLASFCACSQRARQLAEKGLDREAAAMRARADGQRASLSTQALSEDDWVQYVRYLDGADAVAAYADHLSAGPRLPAVERALADRLVIERGWESLDVLDASHPLRRDAGEVMAGVGAMDAGEWARAAALLQGVPRRSPFAAWRLFCKAAVCFDAGDDDGLRRTLDRLPADFPLARTVAEWRRLAAPDDAGPTGAAGGAAGEGGPAAALARELKRALRKGNVGAAGAAIESLADVLYPEDPELARIDLVEIAGLAMVGRLIPGHALEALGRRLLPRGRATAVGARVLLGAQQAEPGLWHPGPAAALFELLPAELPRAEDRPLARACVLEMLARTGSTAVDPELLPAEMEAALNRLLGRRWRDPAMVFVDLMSASLEADPDNRDGHLFLLDLLRGHGAGRRRLEGVLRDMAGRFPDDPTPWLELATLHYARNAYRRAEAALTEARRRAPHDDRLLDLQAVGFLKSADQSRNKGRFRLAARDVERAADLGRRVIEPVLPAKRLLLEIVSGGGDASAAIARRLDPLPPAAQLRTLALVIRDLEDNRHVRYVRPGMADAVRSVLADRSALAGECGPDEVAGLLDPVPPELDMLYHDRGIAPIFDAWWPELLERVDGERLPAALDILMACGGRTQVRAEIERRLRGGGKSRRDPLLLFHLAVLRYQDGSDHDSRRFRDVVDKAGPAAREPLRALAARLARHTQGPLRHALATFDFEPLDLPAAALDGGLPSIGEFLAMLADREPEFAALLEEAGGSARAEPPDPADPVLGERFRRTLTEDAEDAEDGPHQGTLFDRGLCDDLDRLEELIDDNGLRGAPPSDLRELAGNLRAEPRTRRDLDRTARGCEAAGLGDRLSPELHVLLFPRAKRKRR